MAKYVEANLMKSLLLKAAGNKRKQLRIANDFCKMLDITPTADVKPVIHAYWEFCKKCEDYTNIYKCSNCGYIDNFWPIPGEVTVPYCWHCGARMDEVKDET